MEKINLTNIDTSKYKSIIVDMRFSKPYDQKKRAVLAIAGRIIGKYSLKYQTKLEMTKVKDLLYGLKTDSSSKTSGGLMVLAISFEFVNPKFLIDVTMQDYIDFIDECLNNIFFDENIFNETKNNLIFDIQRSLEKPRVVENEMLINEIGRDIETFTMYSKNIIDDLKTLTLDDLKKECNELLVTYRRDFYIIGEKTSMLENYLNKYLKNNHSFYEKEDPRTLVKREDIISDYDADQSYLSIVYQSPYSRGHKDYVASVVTNTLFGACPLSLLFQEVREKMSLCYSIDSMFYRNDGLIRVSTGIDADRLEDVKKGVEKELNVLANGEFDESLLEAVKRLMLNNIDAISDDSDEYINFLYTNDINYNVLEIERYKNDIIGVNKSDVMRVAGNYKPYLCHFLRGSRDE